MNSNETTPLVTVAVITYNQKELLRETIESILSQKTEFSFEILICDDASTDDTASMCLEYEANNSGLIRYLRLEKNSGITANSNQGIKHGKGKYFALIGGDDLFLPNKIQIQTQYMEENPEVTISYHSVDIFDSASNKTLLITNQTKVDTPRTLHELVQICIPGSVSVMVRNDALPECGFDSRLPTVSDWLFYIEVAAKGKIGFIPETLARYRKHGNQASFRTFELLEESLSNLDLAAEKLSDIKDLSFSIKKGKARYLAGEAFRQLMSGNRKLANQLLVKANKQKFNIVYFIGLLLTKIPISKNCYSKTRYFFKRLF
jgi:glycosyltransferase involved in cell wall biosynthesis